MTIIPNAPELLTDAQREQLARQKKHEARQARERSLVRGLIRALKPHGFLVRHVNDGEECVSVKTEAQAIDAVFSVDHSTLVFKHETTGKVRGVFLTCGEGDDIICDHSDAEDFTPHIDAYLVARGLV